MISLTGHHFLTMIKSTDFLHKIKHSNLFYLDRKADYLEAKLYNGFYAFEALTKRDPSQIVCGICGDIPDMLFGEGSFHFTQHIQWTLI